MKTKSILRKYHVPEVLTSLILYSYYHNFKDEKSYIESTYWYEIDPEYVKKIIPVQILSVVGGIIWAYYSRKNQIPDDGILSLTVYGEPMSELLLTTFTLASAVWPWTLPDPANITIMNSLIASIPLWLSSTSGITALVGSFRNDKANWIEKLSIVLFNITFSLIDGIWWPANLISKAN